MPHGTVETTQPMEQPLGNQPGSNTLIRQSPANLFLLWSLANANEPWSRLHPVSFYTHELCTSDCSRRISTLSTTGVDHGGDEAMHPPYDWSGGMACTITPLPTKEMSKWNQYSTILKSILLKRLYHGLQRLWNVILKEIWVIGV